MVVNRHRQHALGPCLADHILIQHMVDVGRSRDAVMPLGQRGLMLFTDDIHAQLDALVTDEHRRPGNQLADFMLALSAERTEKSALVAVFGLRHGVAPRVAVRRTGGSAQLQFMWAYGFDSTIFLDRPCQAACNSHTETVFLMKSAVAFWRRALLDN